MALNNYVLHVNRALTNVSVQYRNAAFVASEIFPSIPVVKQSDDYYVYGLDNLRTGITLMAPRVKSNEAIMQRSPTPYIANGHGKSFPIPDEDRSNDDMDQEIDATTLLTEQILLDREVNLVSQIQTGIASGNLIDLSASSYAAAWDQTTVDPIAAIAAQSVAIALATGKRPNLLILSIPALEGMRNNPLVKARITGAPNLDGSAITLQQIANVCNVKRCIEAAAVVNTAKEGQTDSTSFVWGKSVVLCYVADQAPGLRTMSLGYNFMWNFNARSSAGSDAKPIADLVKGGAGYGVRMWREEGRRTTMIEALLYYAQQIISPNAGVMWTNAVQNY